MSVFSEPAIDYARFDAREVIAAAPDFFAKAFGNAAPVRDLHPLAQSLDLGTIAHAFGQANARPHAGPANNARAVVAQGLASAGFTKLVRDALSPIVLRSYQAAAQQHPFSAVVKMDDFKPQAIYGFDIAHGLARVHENAPAPRRRAFAPDAAHAAAAVATYSQIFELTRDDLLSNDIASIRNALIGAGALAAQVEAGLLAAEIESPTALSDGAVLNDSNTAAAALSAEALGTAFSKLRTQGATGRPLNIAAVHMVVEPGLELAARKLVREADMSVQVSVLPELATGRWLVLGSPELAPSLTLFKLADGVNFAVQRSFKTDGVDLRVSTDVGTSFVSRIGFVRGGA